MTVAQIAARELLTNARQCTWYVAKGQCMIEDVAEEAGCSLTEAKAELSRVALALERHLDSFKA